MSKLEELIQKYCPDGVEYKHLGEICNIKGRIGFRGYTREDQVKEGEGALSLSPSNIQGGQMDYSKGTYITWLKYEESPEIMTFNGDIIFCKTASVGKVALVKNLPYKATINPQLVVLKEIQCNAPYLTYVLGTDLVQSKVVSKAGVGSVPNISQKALSELEIPLPPLPVQEEIVRILDSFSGLQEGLIPTLQAELQKRKQQYSYYRDQLLTNFTPDKDVKEYALGEIGTFTRGNGLQKKDFKDIGVGCIHYGQIYTRFGAFTDRTLTYVDKELASHLLQVEKGDLVIACTSENVEDICKCVAWLGDETICTGGHACVFKHKQNPKYMSYFFQTEHFYNQKVKYTYGTKVKDIKPDSLAKIRIPLPSLKEQERIVSILDNLYTLTSDLTVGLPAEIEARQKQYEYYRDKLLTFKRKEA